MSFWIVLESIVMTGCAVQFFWRKEGWLVLAMLTTRKNLVQTTPQRKRERGEMGGEHAACWIDSF